MYFYLGIISQAIKTIPTFYIIRKELEERVRVKRLVIVWVEIRFFVFEKTHNLRSNPLFAHPIFSYTDEWNQGQNL